MCLAAKTCSLIRPMSRHAPRIHAAMARGAREIGEMMEGGGPDCGAVDGGREEEEEASNDDEDGGADDDDAETSDREDKDEEEACTMSSRSAKSAIMDKKWMARFISTSG